MLVVSNISKQFRDESILKNISFTVNAGERVGLVGPNGCGKSTLLKIIIGEMAADSGSVQFIPVDLRIGYLPQGLSASNNLTIRDILFPQLVELTETEIALDRLAQAMAEASEKGLDHLMDEYDRVLTRLELLSQVIDVAGGEQLLAALGLGNYPLETSIAVLSGGQKTRLGMAALLSKNPHLLILDEPTNHLDITALEWLEAWLQDFSGGALIVSHDRTFLDRAVTHIVDITSQTARVFTGNYRSYVETIQSEQDKQWAQWRDQQAEIIRLQEDIRRTMDKANRKENATIDSTQRRYAKKVAKRAKAKEKRLARYLASEDRVEKPKPIWGLKLDFADLPTTGRDVVELDDLAIGYGEKLVLKNLNLTVKAGERVVVLGPNGHGKSTLLKTIIGEIAPLAGQVRIGASVQIGYLAQEQDFLDPALNAVETLLAEVPMSHTEARAFLHFFLFTGEDALRTIHTLSFGERSRLMLALLVARGSNLLILDEPINHLDVSAREKFEQALAAFAGSVIAVVHDRYFVDKFATTIWHVENGDLIEAVVQPFFS